MRAAGSGGSGLQIMGEGSRMRAQGLQSYAPCVVGRT